MLIIAIALGPFSMRPQSHGSGRPQPPRASCAITKMRLAPASVTLPYKTSPAARAPATRPHSPRPASPQSLCRWSRVRGRALGQLIRLPLVRGCRCLPRQTSATATALMSVRLHVKKMMFNWRRGRQSDVQCCQSVLMLMWMLIATGSWVVPGWLRPAPCTHTHTDTRTHTRAPPARLSI